VREKDFWEVAALAGTCLRREAMSGQTALREGRRLERSHHKGITFIERRPARQNLLRGNESGERRRGLR
jgi:hypothetical protein